MQQGIRQLLELIYSSLEEQAQVYARPFFQLGADIPATRELLAHLQGTRQQLWSLESHFTPARWPAAARLYALAYDALRTEIAFIETVIAGARGSTANTARAAQNAAETLLALARLIAIIPASAPPASAGPPEPAPSKALNTSVTDPVEPSPVERLHRILAESFSVDELRVLCADLDIPYEDLEGNGHTARCASLVSYCGRRGLADKLIARVSQLRPHLFQ